MSVNPSDAHRQAAVGVQPVGDRRLKPDLLKAAPRSGESSWELGDSRIAIVEVRKVIGQSEWSEGAESECPLWIDSPGEKHACHRNVMRLDTPAVSIGWDNGSRGRRRRVKPKQPHDDEGVKLKLGSFL